MDTQHMVTVDVPLGPALTEERAREIFAQGEEAVVFALLTLAKLAAASSPASDSNSPSAPSGMKPPHLKPSATSKRKKKPGQKPGHIGTRRPKPPPERIDACEEHRADRCPDCGGPLNRCAETRKRYIEDIPRDIQPVVTEHTIHRDWCPQCQKKVEPLVPDALRGSPLGHHVLVLTAWLHYALGNTLAQIVDVLGFHLQFRLTRGGLLQMWYRLQGVLFPWYEQIQCEALDSAVLHADETGWRVNGKTHWLWCFTTARLTYYMIHRSRGHPALLEFFTSEFGGILVSDFWGAYNAVACALRQTCLVHLLRDLKHVEKYKSTAHDWPDFAKSLRRLLGDAIRLWRKREELPAETYASRRERLGQRLQSLIDTPWRNGQARRLIKRLKRHRGDLFTFLDHAGVPFDNNHAEREVRPAVIIRKNSYGNRSEVGADAQAVLMTIFRTLKQRGHQPMQTIIEALRTYVLTGKLPPFPQ
jgi:transposase